MDIYDLDRTQKICQYVMQMRPAFNVNALFSDETSNYVSPMEPEPGETIAIRFRTGKDNVDAVYFVCGAEREQMSFEQYQGDFDYYFVVVPLKEEPIFYYFEVHVGKLKFYYNKRGASKDIQEYYAFSVVPGFKTPDWAKGAVMYQIFVDRFYNGDPSNDVEDREYFYIGAPSSRVTDWEKYPEYDGIREFYGGDLQGVKEKLDYLQDLGVEVVYFNPIFVSPSNHKYDIQDYDYIDPHYGRIVNDGGEVLAEGDKDNSRAGKYIRRVTNLDNLNASNEMFAQLVEEIHQRGMRVILDGVFNHCGSFNKWLDRERIYEEQPGYEKGAYVSADSPYRSFFKFHNEETWPYNPNYDGWWGHDTLPKLGYESSPMLYEYIMRITKKWLSPPYNVDGWRLDVAADLGFSNEYNHKFWKEFRKVVKEANPEALILAEHYGDAKAWLRGDEWDTVMNYDAFMEPMTWFFTGMEKHSDEYRADMIGNEGNFIGAMSHHMCSFLAPSLQVSMNELSNHDHSRFLTRTNARVGRVAQLGHQAAEVHVKKAVFREAVVMQMTWPGAPTLYYGDEAGLCGFTDPDNRRSYPWGREDVELIRFHKDIIRIHKENLVFSHGSLKFLSCQRNVISYGRFTEDEQIIVIFNNNQEIKSLTVPVWEAGVESDCALETILITQEEGYTLGGATYPVVNGELQMSLPATSAVILKAVRE